MNSEILNNLYELWSQIGKLNGKLIQTELYSAVLMEGSDWPNRVFDLSPDNEVFEVLLRQRKENELPEAITLTKPNTLSNNPDFDLIFGQRNMALDLNSIKIDYPKNKNIKRVTSKEDSINFADTASKAFGYDVDYHVINNIVECLESIRLFIYQEGHKSLGCGMIFIDSSNIAGLHMIGTLPDGRGKGIGQNITERLLTEAMDSEINLCVLHASLMGESIYKKLGFIAYSEIETYRMLTD